MSLMLSEIAERLGVALQHKGDEYVGLCPLHDEDTPSFYVNNDKGVFYCFGCGEGGGSQSLVSKALGVDFDEAKCIIAEWEGKPCTEDKAFIPKQAKDRLIAYLSAKLEGPPLEYLHTRGFTDDTISDFQIGFLDDLDSAMQAARMSVEQVESFGLDKRFDNRVMIPIRNTPGMLIGFAGRAISNDQKPKYLTSFGLDKSKLLFALDKARSAIKESGDAVVVEGQFDAIALHQDGVRTAVAVMGTSFGILHALALKRAGAERVYYLADGDNAGLNALIRASRIAKALRLKFLPYQFEPGKDAADYIGRLGNITQQVKSEAVFWFEKASSKFDDPADIALYVADIMPVHGKLDPAFREFAMLMKRNFNVGINELYGVFSRGSANKKVEFYKNLGPDVISTLSAILMEAGSIEAYEYAKQLFPELQMDTSKLRKVRMKKRVERDIDQLYLAWLNAKIDEEMAKDSPDTNKLWLLRATADLYLGKWDYENR